jgi:lipoprotein signal peptidase
MTFKLKHWIFFILLVVLDQASKLLAHLQGLVVLNPGVSFGLLFQVPYQILSSVILVILLAGVVLWQKYLSRTKWAAVWFFAGGISNVVDRFLVGAVRDWLSVPLLGNKNNLADWFIFIGIMVVVVSFLQKESNNV